MVDRLNLVLLWVGVFVMATAVVTMGIVAWLHRYRDVAPRQRRMTVALAVAAGLLSCVVGIVLGKM